MIHIKDRNGKLLHIVVRVADFSASRISFTGPENFLQCALLNLKKGDTFKPHQHIWKDGPGKIIAQESWVVIKGLVKVDYYDTYGRQVRAEYLNEGDASITFAGGHNYTAMSEENIIYEFKSGPYTGIENDKIFI